MRRLRAATWTVAVGAMLAVGACTDGVEPAPPPIQVAWREVSLPPPPPGERNVLRAAAVCAGQWYLLGAYGGAGDATRPAAWTSEDGEHWSPMAIKAESYYGVRSVLFSAACHEGQLAALGGRVGGAHGNPRVSSYHLVPAADGTEVLTEVLARFELYGGPTATNVGRLSAGAGGFIIAGNRSSGAAVWLSSDASRFDILEGAPGLATTPERVTWASDAASHDGRWVVVGGTVATGRIDRDAAVWTSVDGSMWDSVAAPSSPEYDEMSLVADQGDGLVAVGLNGSTFQAWRLSTDGWQFGGRFGSTRPTESTPATRVTAVAAVDLGVVRDTVVAAVVVGGAHQLWWSSDAGTSWRAASAPIPMPAGVDKGVAVAGIPGSGGSPDRVLISIDDATGARVFLSDVGA